MACVRSLAVLVQLTSCVHGFQFGLLKSLSTERLQAPFKSHGPGTYAGACALGVCISQAAPPLPDTHLTDHDVVFAAAVAAVDYANTAALALLPMMAVYAAGRFNQEEAPGFDARARAAEVMKMEAIENAESQEVLALPRKNEGFALDFTAGNFACIEQQDASGKHTWICV